MCETMNEIEVLRESERRFRSLADDLPLILWLQDEEGRQQLVNNTFCEYFGVDREGGLGERWRCLVHPDDEPAYVGAFYESVRNRAPFHAEVRVRRADGEWRWLESWGRPRFDEDGNYLGHAGASVDITLRKQMEEDLVKHRDALKERVSQRTKELERQNQRLRQLAHQLSQAEHRDRCKFAQGLHDGLQQILIAAKIQLSLCNGDRVERTVLHLRELLEEAIQASRTLSYELCPPTLENSPLPEALKWLASWFETHHDFDVVLCVEEGFPEFSNDDKVFLFSAVRELLLNAVKYSGCKAARVECRRAEPSIAEVIVSDCGHGFDPRVLIAKQDLGSFGLLSVQERLVALGGQLEITSHPGEGALFRLLLPVEPLHAT